MELQHATNIDVNLQSPELLNNQPDPFLHSLNHKRYLTQQIKNLQQIHDKAMSLLNRLELQIAYHHAWRVRHPDVNTPFASLEDALERLLPYHLYYEEETIIASDTTNQTRSRSQLWDDQVAAKVAEFTARFEKQAQICNKLTSDGFRSEERLMIEMALLEDEKKTCNELKSEMDREKKVKSGRLAPSDIPVPNIL